MELAPVAGMSNADSTEETAAISLEDLRNCHQGVPSAYKAGHRKGKGSNVHWEGQVCRGPLVQREGDY